MHFRCLLFLILMIAPSAILPRFSEAADDDEVVESAGSPPSIQPAMQRTRVSIYEADEAAITEVVADVERQFKPYLTLVARECSLSPEQIDKVRIAAKRDIRNYVNAVAARSPIGAMAAHRESVQSNPEARWKIVPSLFIEQCRLTSKVLTHD